MERLISLDMQYLLVSNDQACWGMFLQQAQRERDRRASGEVDGAADVARDADDRTLEFVRSCRNAREWPDRGCSRSLARQALGR